MLVVGDVRDALDDHRPGVEQLLLEVADLADPSRHFRRGGSTYRYRDDGVFVVRTVEDGDRPRCRNLLADPPQEPVSGFLGGWWTEGGHVQAARVEEPADVLGDPVLTRCVQTLEHDEERPIAVGDEPLVQIAELHADVGERPLSRLPVADARGRVGRIARQVDGPVLGRAQTQLVADVEGSLGSSAPSTWRC